MKIFRDKVKEFVGRKDSKRASTAQAMVTLLGKKPAVLPTHSADTIKKVQEAFKLGSKEEAMRVIALRNEISTIEMVVHQTKRAKGVSYLMQGTNNSIGD